MFYCCQRSSSRRFWIIWNVFNRRCAHWIWLNGLLWTQWLILAIINRKCNIIISWKLSLWRYCSYIGRLSFKVGENCQMQAYSLQWIIILLNTVPCIRFILAKPVHTVLSWPSCWYWLDREDMKLKSTEDLLLQTFGCLICTFWDPIMLRHRQPSWSISPQDCLSLLLAHWLSGHCWCMIKRPASVNMSAVFVESRLFARRHGGFSHRLISTEVR